jgi:hypothetical protein
MKTELLFDLLDDVRRSAGRSFSGVGVLISSSPRALPIVPLRPFAVMPPFQSTREVLAAISDYNHELHDGFHVILPDFRILLLSQYFSPPIIAEICHDPRRQLGGRYMAALFGSALPSVLATGIASAEYGVAVFEGGREVAVAS